MIDINEEEQVFNIYHDESGTYKKTDGSLWGSCWCHLKKS